MPKVLVSPKVASILDKYKRAGLSPFQYHMKYSMNADDLSDLISFDELFKAIKNGYVVDRTQSTIAKYIEATVSQQKNSVLMGDNDRVNVMKGRLEALEFVLKELGVATEGIKEVSV